MTAHKPKPVRRPAMKQPDGEAAMLVTPTTAATGMLVSMQRKTIRVMGGGKWIAEVESVAMATVVGLKGCRTGRSNNSRLRLMEFQRS